MYWKGGTSRRRSSAVVGGNLTGCATAWFLEKSYADLRKEYELRARCQEDDSDVLPPPPENFKVTIFEKRSVLGGNKLQTEIIEDVAVEAGRNSTLHSDGVYVGEVLDQMSSELELDRFWLEGTGYHSVRSFAIYDADNSEYLFRHGGYWGLDILKVVASSIFTRFLLLVGCGFALYHGRFEMSGLARLKTIAAAVFVFISLVLFPRRFLASVNRSLAFWSSAIVGLMTYGTTAALSRGASKGFTDHFKAMLKANATTKSITLGHLFNRCGLGSYSSTDAESAFRSFKFLPAFVRHYSDTQLQVDYANSQLAAKDVSTLAAMLCQQRADVSEGDKVLRIRGGNAKLCEALGRGSRQMLNAAAVKIKKRSAEEIESGKQAYILSYKIPAQAEPVEEEFNAIVLACSPNMEELTFETPGMDNSGDVFGYTKEILTTQTPGNRSRWLALVAGTLNHRCLGHLIADTVPDMILSTSGKDWLKIECVAESKKGKIWSVICTEEPKAGEGLIAELFTNVREMKVRERSQPKYKTREFINGVDGNDVPSLILGTRFINAAGMDRLSCDPETDIISAWNAASLFSVGVNWMEEKEESQNAPVDELTS